MDHSHGQFHVTSVMETESEAEECRLQRKLQKVYMTEQGQTGTDKTRQDQDMTGVDKTGLKRTGQDKTRQKKSRRN